ncbi:Fic family protein [Agathobacter sp.]
MATMRSSPKSSDQVSDQVDNDQVTEKILEFCKIARTKKEISEHIGYKNLIYMTRKYIKPLLESGNLVYTIPDKTKSRFQKYLTKK